VHAKTKNAPVTEIDALGVASTTAKKPSPVEHKCDYDLKSS
jgi:hypothetical protein